METTTSAAPGVPRLRRTLTLWDLIFYGIVLIQPIAPVPLYGVAQKLSDGHFVTIILIALFAMLITAVSYGRMGTLYPTAGSAYTYVGKGLNPHLGFLAGWAMILDYLLQPLINTVWISTALHERYVQQVPFMVWALLIAGIMTVLNLIGVKASARANKVLLGIMSVVVVAFVVLALKYLYGGQGWAGLFSLQPLYNPKTFDSHKILTATSFAALTYIGFDGVTTLAEDVENPKRNVLPKKFFGKLKPGTSTPTNNILLIGGLSFVGAVLLDRIGSAYQHAGELLNFGAFLAFMGVNFACFWQFSVISKKTGKKRRLVRDAILPIMGFLFCLVIWINLNIIAKTVGGIWFAIGILYVGYKTNWFRSAPVMIDFSDN